MKLISILIAEDYTIVRRGIVSLLRLQPEFNVVAEVENGQEAVEKTAQLQPDVVLMDITMPVLNGLQATAMIKKDFPHIKVLIVTAHDSEDFIVDTIRAGGDGYVFKNTNPDDLNRAIIATVSGFMFFSPTHSPEEIKSFIQRARDSHEILTPREIEILTFIGDGLSHQKIAEMLHLSIRTIDTHRNNIMQKLDIHDTASLVHYALRRGYIRLQ